MKPFQMTLSIIAIAALSACGGGGSSSTTSTTTTTTTSSTTDAADTYVGTWLSACYANSSTVTQTVNGSELLSNYTALTTIKKLSATTANAAIVYTFYANSDTQCSGTPIYTITKTGDATSAYSQSATAITSSMGQNLLTIVSSVTVGGQAADQVTNLI
jgi:hypothetical protein